MKRKKSNSVTGAQRTLAGWLRTHHPVPTVRVSSALCGSCCPYPYWGAVRYEVRLTADGGAPANIALGRCGRDRRSIAGAKRDAEATGRMPCQEIGRLSHAEAAAILGVVAPEWTRLRQSRQSRQPAPVASLALRLEHRKRCYLARDLRIETSILGISHGAPSVIHRDAGHVTLTYLERPYLAGPGRLIIPGLPWVWDMSLRPTEYRPWGDQRDSQEFLAADNVEMRRMIWEACSDRLHTAIGMTEAQRDDYGVLYRYDVADGHAYNPERYQMVLVVNATPEPDGTYRDYWLRVPPYVRTARAAVASTFGLAAEEYAPLQAA